MNGYSHPLRESKLVFTGKQKVLMRHDWIFEVLNDLRRYAIENGLTATAAKTEEALRVARFEISSLDDEGGSDGGSDGGASKAAPKGRPN